MGGLRSALWTKHPRQSADRAIVEISCSLSFGSQKLKMKQEISGRESYRSFSEPLLQIKSDTRITDASAAACELLGISREELVGKYLSDFLLDKSVSNKFQKPSAKLHSDVLTLCNRDGAQLRMHTMLFQ